MLPQNNYATLKNNSKSSIINNENQNQIHLKQDSQQQLNYINEEKPILCREHKDFVSLYCPDDKTLLCVNCLYQNDKHKRHNVLPLKQSLELLKSENKQFKSEAKDKMVQIDQSIKICSSNKYLLELGYQNSVEQIEREFSELFSQLKNQEMKLKEDIKRLFQDKLQESDTMSTDLNYLKNCLKENNNKEIEKIESQNFTIYLFSIYNMIKKTLSKVDFNFKQITMEDLNIIDFNSKNQISKTIQEFGFIFQDIQLREQKKQQVTTHNVSNQRTPSPYKKFIHQNIDPSSNLHQVVQIYSNNNNNLKGNNNNPSVQLNKKNDLSSKLKEELAIKMNQDIYDQDLFKSQTKSTINSQQYQTTQKKKNQQRCVTPTPYTKQLLNKAENSETVMKNQSQMEIQNQESQQQLQYPESLQQSQVTSQKIQFVQNQQSSDKKQQQLFEEQENQEQRNYQNQSQQQQQQKQAITFSNQQQMQIQKQQTQNLKQHKSQLSAKIYTSRTSAPLKQQIQQNKKSYYELLEQKYNNKQKRPNSKLDIRENNYNNSINFNNNEQSQ